MTQNPPGFVSVSVRFRPPAPMLSKFSHYRFVPFSVLGFPVVTISVIFCVSSSLSRRFTHEQGTLFGSKCLSHEYLFVEFTLFSTGFLGRAVTYIALPPNPLRLPVSWGDFLRYFSSSFITQKQRLSNTFRKVTDK